MYQRDLSSTAKRYTKLPVIAILGPRQSGKTTIAKTTFPNHLYFNFENPQIKELVETDPQRFLDQNRNDYGIIIDEFQNIPRFLSYIQIEVDEYQKDGYFVLTGSQNFLMNQAISQSLAGRVGILTLLPLSLSEIVGNNLLQDKLQNSLDKLIFSGGYPRLYSKDLTSEELYPSYIQTYVERDVRELINVLDLKAFRTFLKLCAARNGQLLNLSNLANEAGISMQTVKKWLSVLEASYIIFFLQPYYKNFSKRVIKTPKLYFYDTGLVCSLLQIKSEEDLSLSPMRSSLFETLMISDFYKQYLNAGIFSELYFWQDKNTRYEVDCLLEKRSQLFSFEFKSGSTFFASYFKNQESFRNITEQGPENTFVVYGGDVSQDTQLGRLVSWKDAYNLIATL